jgi:deazaflavin-dependent oxidoreductase (nitroreductase family)
MTEMPTDVKAYNRKLIEEFRANGGALAGRAIVLLTTTGARTGQPRTTPMMYVPDGDRLLVIASNAGAPRHPDWYRNLVANPRVTVEVDGQTYPATAVVLAGDERDRRWESITNQYPFFVEHQSRIARLIPVVALVRRDG